MTDASAGRDNAKISKGVLAPAQEDVPFLVAVDLQSGVDEIRGIGTVFIDLHRVIDDEIYGLQRVDPLCVAAELHDRIAHGGEIDDGGHASEVL